MALTKSNTYIEPTAASSLAISRAQMNDSIRSILANFKSDSAPTAVNLVADGAALGEQDGMLFRSSDTNALYISDTAGVKSSPVGGNFTRVGIGNRVENGILALASNVASYEIGELIATVSADGVLSSNARLYLCSANSSTMSDMVDIGITPGLSVDTGSNVTATAHTFTTTNASVTASLVVGTDITAGGNINSTSDKRLKSNIHNIDNALTKVLSMRGVYYTMNGNDYTGVVAQEIERVLPEVVTDDMHGYKTVAYGNIVGVLIEAIKELEKEVETLRSRSIYRSIYSYITSIVSRKN